MARKYIAEYRRAELLDAADVIRMLGLTATELNRLVAEKRFPLPVIGETPGVPLWRRDEILDWRDLRWLARSPRAQGGPS